MRPPAALEQARFPEAILDVLRRLSAAGHRSWLVGGAVRDLLLHRPRAATDFDVATPATPRQVMALFRRVIPTGIDHGTVTVLVGDEKVEVTTFRGEGDYVDGRRPASVTFLAELEADLARRDFTMNAMAYDPLQADFRDPFDGRVDMSRRRIRAVGEPAARFGEDGLRAMRAVRFAAQLGYRLDPATRAAIPGALEVVRKVSVERVAEELSRLVLAAHAGSALLLLRRTGLLGVVLPAIAALPLAAYRHAVAVVRHAPAEPALRLAALLHGVGPEEASKIVFGLRLPRRLSDEVGTLVRAYACPAARHPAALPDAPADIRRWLARTGPQRVPAVFELVSAELRTLSPARRAAVAPEVSRARAAIDAELAAAPPLATGDLALDGRAVMSLLGEGPGPHVGEALHHLLDRVLEDPAQNTREALAAELRRWWAGRTGAL
ncbi:tRNA cytidylyltransferase [Anaeromyxobacter sp. K]|uniref:CCA tRNA nucleotidyltransferase n=1 Tax=Anaeromyxobacter sp. (strain K) TaxID=447217 RepID=UPI00015F9F12|nr:tRNA cytidylyltransferase [Anaeromyxobacter sp. K]ACG73614.1 tRNA cytidylyltransferase [Anaeromyxobacter sp. K]